MSPEKKRNLSVGLNQAEFIRIIMQDGTFIDLHPYRKDRICFKVPDKIKVQRIKYELNKDYRGFDY